MSAREITPAEQIAADVALAAVVAAGRRPVPRAIDIAVRALGDAGLLTSAATAADQLGGYARALATVRANAASVHDSTSLLALLHSLASSVEVVVYRAEHGTIPLGWYLTPAAAREHCEDLVRREKWDWDVRLRLDWLPDDQGAHSVEGLTVWDAGAPAEEPIDTGYSVTPIVVDEAYAPDAEE